MPVTPQAGVPPMSTLQAVEVNFSHVPTPYMIAPGLNRKNFYSENGQIILASIVAIMFLVLLFLSGSFFATQKPTYIKSTQTTSFE